MGITGYLIKFIKLLINMIITVNLIQLVSLFNKLLLVYIKLCY